MRFLKQTMMTAALAAVVGIPAASGASKPLNDSFTDHGVCTPVSSLLGITSANGPGNSDVLVGALSDHRGPYGLLILDTESGKCEQRDYPFKPSSFHSIFASLLGGNNRYYLNHSSHFIEFDPETLTFTFVGKVHDGMSMGMTEDRNGVIWSVTYPDSGVISFDPKSRKLTDYGSVNKESWPQYQRTVATDDAGWVYFGIGNTKAQIMGFNPATRKTIAVFPQSKRPAQTSGQVFPGADGKVYATVTRLPNYRSMEHAWTEARKKADLQWYRLYDGKFEPIQGQPEVTLRPVKAGSQNFANYALRNNRKVEIFNIVDRYCRIADPATDRKVTHKLDYSSEGAHLMSVAAANGKFITGGTAFPMRNYIYDPGKDTLINRNGTVQWNTVLPWKNHVFVGGYNGGYLIDWDLDGKEFREFPRNILDSHDNPRCIGRAVPDVIRPHTLEITADGRYVMMGGTPEYGHTGGGLAIWDRQTDQFRVLKNEALLKDLSIYTLTALPDGRVFGGTSVVAGTGGQVKAKEARFFELDPATGKILWDGALLPRVQTYHDTMLTPDGKILGIADSERIFVFDPATRKVVATGTTGEYGPAVWQQGPRMFVTDGTNYYLLCRNHILQLNPKDGKILRAFESPVPIQVGGDILNGRLYFASGSHLISFQLPEKQD